LAKRLGRIAQPHPERQLLALTLPLHPASRNSDATDEIELLRTGTCRSIDAGGGKDQQQQASRVSVGALLQPEPRNPAFK
jgi:hypothetical protein